MNGIKRFKQAIKNQQDFGNGEFYLAYPEAEEIAAEIEDEFSWADGVPAPVDASGEVVPLTTKVMYDKNGEEVKISRFSLTNDGFKQSRWVWNVRMLTGFIVNIEDLHLHRPDSWERLEEDVDRMQSHGACHRCNYFSLENIKCSECPAGGNKFCGYYIAHDVLRRAKALVEREAKEATPQPSPHEAKEGDRD